MSPIVLEGRVGMVCFTEFMKDCISWLVGVLLEWRLATLALED